MKIEDIEIELGAQTCGGALPPDEAATEATDRLHPPLCCVSKAVVVGLGNIGSHLVGYLARMDSAVQLALIDPDRYEPGNLGGQEMTRRDLGQAKVIVQARRVRRIAAQAKVRVYEARIQELPLAILRANVIFACVDNRAARRYLAEAAWRLGVPLVEGAVDSSALMGRAAVYVPGPGTGCLLCAWSDKDFETQEQDYPCGGNAAVTTRAPAELGAVVASLMAAEGRKLLERPGPEDNRPKPCARYLLFDLRHQTYQMTTITRNPQCRFDHTAWQIQQLPEPPSRLTVGELLRRALPDARRTEGRSRHGARIWLPIPAQGFARQVVCPECRHKQPIDLRLEGRIARRGRLCNQCGTLMDVNRFDTLDSLEGPDLVAQLKARTRLSHLGFVAGDVVAVSIGGMVQCFELGAEMLAAGATGLEGFDQARAAGR